jgi:diguanylate cyclase (GGDEF)-like protein
VQSIRPIPAQITYRGLLQERLAHACLRAARRDDGFTLAMVDIDDFRAVNDSYGNAAGAAVLKEIASRMKQCLRESDTVARLDGDEFALVLEGTADESAAARALDKVLAALGSPLYVNGERVAIELSIGACIYTANSAREDALLRCAEFALAAAKSAGGNCYRFFSQAAAPRDPASEH